MKAKELEELSFEEAIDRLNEEGKNIASYMAMENLVSEAVHNGDLDLAYHVLGALVDNPNTEWFKYDYSMGTMEEPEPLNELEDLEQFCEDDEEKEEN